MQLLPEAWLYQWREHPGMGRMENDWCPLNAAERKHWPPPWYFSDCESKGQGHSLVGRAPTVDFTDEIAEGQKTTVVSQCCFLN